VGQAGLAPEPEPHRGTVDTGVPIAERRQPERAVQSGVLVVADTDQRQLEQPNHGGQDLIARQAAHGKIRVTAPPDPRQRLGECQHAVELVGAPALVPVRVVAVLFAATRVPATGLDMAVRPRADPHIRPRGRDREGPDPAERLLVANRRAVSVLVGEAPT
jgi:hypothetical protein